MGARSRTKVLADSIDGTLERFRRPKLCMIESGIGDRGAACGEGGCGCRCAMGTREVGRATVRLRTFWLTLDVRKIAHCNKVCDGSGRVK